MSINILGDIDAGYYERELTTKKTGVEMWHDQLAEYATLAKDAIGLALGACRRGASMANALNTPSGKLREATEKLAIDATVLLGGPTPASGGRATLGGRIATLDQTVKSYRDRLGISPVYQGKEERGDALVNTLRQINELIGGAPHFTNPHVPGSPLPIKPASFSDFITAFDHFQRALENLYASPQTVPETTLKDSAGHPQYSIYAQDGARTLRNQGAELLKKMLAADHADVLGTSHMLEQHGAFSMPRESHDSFATRLFDPMAEIAIRGLPIQLEDALMSDAPAILIHGDGGCGKTVALWRFGLKTNTDGEREDIALYTKLDAPFPSLTLRKQIEAAARYASDSRRVYVLFDGLDEVRSRRSQVVIAITDLISTYPKLFWRISTRELGEEVPEETRVWHVFKMEPFGAESIVSGI